MSNAGQAFLTVVGTIVGTYFGYPQLGFLLGSLAGQALFPTQLPTVQGPRLADLGQTRSDVGGPIPKGWGTFPSPGMVIWQSRLREVIESEEVGGKGGSSQTVETPTYFQDFAIGLCEGEIEGVRRIWANGKLLYDRRPQLAAESDDAFQQRMTAAQALDEQMTIYLGSETQLPDPTIEAELGVNEISAFRGLAYIVFENWQNKGEDGNRMPAQWKFEIYTDGIPDAGDINEYSNEVLYHWTSGSDPRHPLGAFEYTIADPGLSPFNGMIGQEYSSVGAAIGAIESARDKSFGSFMGYRIPGDTQLSTVLTGQTVADADTGSVQFRFNLQAPSRGFREAIASNCDDFITYGMNKGNFGETVWSNNIFAGHASVTAGGLYKNQSQDDRPAIAPKYDFVVLCNPLYEQDLHHSSDAAVRVFRETQAPSDPCADPNAVEVPGFPGYCVLNGALRKAGAWTLESGVTYRVLQVTSGLAVGAVVQQYPLNPARPIGHADYNNQAFWEAAYALEVARGTIEAGLVYGAVDGYPITQTFGYYRALSSATVDTVPVLLSTIIEDICADAGMDPENVDTSDLGALAVIGYVRSRTMTGRGAIEPLRSIGFFDAVESGRALKFIRRGHPHQLALTTDQIGAYLTGQTAPPAITTRKAQEVDLPRSIRVHYISYARDYESGEQPSPSRVDTEATNDIDIELAAVLDDEQAAQIAEVLWADFWNSRWTHETAVDTEFLALEPTDCVVVPVDGDLQRVRIVNIEDNLPVLRRLTLNRDDDGSYVSQAAASSVPVTSTPVRILGPTAVVLLDLPPLQDADDDAGFYAAFRPLIADETFLGATLVRSADGGGSYQKIAQGMTTVATGSMVTALPAAAATVWDEGNELRVELYVGTLESRTEAAVIGGANAAAIGVDGRWEIVQFRDAILLAGTIWSLTGLLRGRRGTERFIGQSVAGDTFVMLSAGGLVRVPHQTAEIGMERLYRAVTANNPISSAVDQTFTGRGMALLPFSPGFIAGSRDASFNLTITWVRRDRFGQPLQPTITMPMSEAFEDYEVEILDSAGVVVRTISVSIEEAVYSAAEQVTDFGVVQPAVAVIVYQLSQAVGRGPGEEATV